MPDNKQVTSCPIDFSVIVPTCHRNDDLARCLTALAPTKQQAARLVSTSTELSISPDATLTYEVLITDDGIESTAEQMVAEAFPWAAWHKGPARGPAANRNNGARRAQGKWLVFIDDDCLPDAKLLRSYQIAIEQNPSVEALEGSILPSDTEKPSGIIQCPVNTDGGHFWSANVAIHKHLFDRLNGFDEHIEIAAHEDQDLFIRIQKHSQVTFEKDAIAYHPWRKSSVRKELSLFKSKTDTWLYFAGKHPQKIRVAGFGRLWLHSVRRPARQFLKNLIQRNHEVALVSLLRIPFNFLYVPLAYSRYKCGVDNRAHP